MDSPDRDTFNGADSLSAAALNLCDLDAALPLAEPPPVRRTASTVDAGSYGRHDSPLLPAWPEDAAADTRDASAYAIWHQTGTGDLLSPGRPGGGAFVLLCSPRPCAEPDSFYATPPGPAAGGALIGAGRGLPGAGCGSPGLDDRMSDGLLELPTAPQGPTNQLYKTELCRSWGETGSCRYGAKCQFAHGFQEVRPVNRHPKYKTEVCRTFNTSGTCPYGTRCRFIHFRGSDAAGLEAAIRAHNLNLNAPAGAAGYASAAGGGHSGSGNGLMAGSPRGSGLLSPTSTLHYGGLPAPRPAAYGGAGVGAGAGGGAYAGAPGALASQRDGPAAYHASLVSSFNSSFGSTNGGSGGGGGGGSGGLGGLSSVHSSMSSLLLSPAGSSAARSMESSPLGSPRPRATAADRERAGAGTDAGATPCGGAASPAAVAGGAAYASRYGGMAFGGPGGGSSHARLLGGAANAVAAPFVPGRSSPVGVAGATALLSPPQTPPMASPRQRRLPFFQQIVAE